MGTHGGSPRGVQVQVLTPPFSARLLVHRAVTVQAAATPLSENGRAPWACYCRRLRPLSSPLSVMADGRRSMAVCNACLDGRLQRAQAIPKFNSKTWPSGQSLCASLAGEKGTARA